MSVTESHAQYLLQTTRLKFGDPEQIAAVKVIKNKIRRSELIEQIEDAGYCPCFAPSLSRCAGECDYDPEDLAVSELEEMLARMSATGSRPKTK